MEQFDYELPVYDRNDSYRARLFLTDEEYKTVRRMELNGVLRILHHANVVGGYLVDDRKPKRKNARKNKEEPCQGSALAFFTPIVFQKPQNNNYFELRKENAK